MNIAQIENNISNLINNFSKENYIYDLLLAYGIPKNTITLLKKGKRNLSKRDDQLILKKKILFQEVISEDPHLIIDLIANEKESYRHDPRFIIVTNYKELLAIDTKTKETLDIDVKDFDKNFVFFLPLAGMEKTQHKNENPADVKAAEKMAKIYDEILKENDFKTDEDLHALNVYLSRLLFCFFAEDTGIFDQGIFTNSISSYTQLDGSDLNSFFGTLFEVLNIEVKERYNYPEYLNKFPYVNGGLFRKKHTNLKFSSKVAVAVRARRGHQLGDTFNQLQRGEGDLIGLYAALVVRQAAGLAVLLGAAVDQLAARFAQPLHGKRRAGAVAQQPLQPGAVVRRYAHAGVHRKPAVLVAQHLLGLETLQQAPSDKGVR